MAALAGTSLVAAADADQCNGATHCYALRQTETVYEASWVNLLTNSAGVPAASTGARFQNEQWVNFPDGGWLEAGVTAGWIGAGSAPDTWAGSPVYFLAVAEPVSVFTEVDYPNGPGIGNWFTTRIGDIGGGMWCEDFGGGWARCEGSLPYYSHRLDMGLEVAAPDGGYPVNNGSALGWAERLVDGAWVGWSPSYYSWQHNNCVFGVATSGNPQPVGIAFGTPNANPSCFNIITGAPDAWGWGYSTALRTGASAARGAAEATVPVDATGAVPRTPPGVPAFPGRQADPPQPAEGFVADKGALLSDARLKAIATAAVTSSAAKGTEPTSVSITRPARLDAVLQTLSPEATFPEPDTKGLANFLGSDVAVLVLHGDFTLESAPRPPDAKAPSGSVLSIVVDARTGQQRAVQVSDDAPKSVAALGKTTKVAIG